ncbi:hypothetical protein [Brevundimonas viscosa]|uniref:Uncharacterized protein n=1 Tax=Brevundimonas viscosa TaxID=871741 RepID=A0A1I6SJF5_9CAUL|nr:hypothetical protein [Brevundimonas viscosa]SFS77101.1 hypothetical protein SAMN05192570_2492 [Brevundimonas viscosa]
MSETNYEAMFADLCRQVGFCLHPKGEARVIAALPKGLDAGVRAVLEAEGVDEPSASGDLKRAIRDCLKAHVGKG